MKSTSSSRFGSTSSARFGSTNLKLGIILLSSLASLGLHAYLALQHFAIKYGTSSGDSLCTINSKFNCDVVAMSPYSEFLGIPMAVWGTAFHICLSIIAFCALSGLNSNPARLNRVLQVFGVLGLLATAVMGLISLLFMNTYCLFCIFTYVFSVVIFAASLGLESLDVKEILGDFTSLFGEQKWIALMFALIPGFAFLGQAILKDRFGGDRLKYLVQESIASWKTSTAYNFDPAVGISYGNSSARFVLVEFADFLCPHCKMASPTLHGFVQSRNDSKVILKLYPLDGSCNSEISRAGDGLRCKLAQFAMCAERMAGKGWPASEWIFEHQERHSIARWEEDLKAVTASLGLSLADVKTCMDSPETQEAIKKMIQEASQAKIRGTPAIFANGKLLEGGQILEVLRSAHEL